MSAAPMTAEEEIAAITDVLQRADRASREAAMYLNDVVIGEYAQGRSHDAVVPAAEIARLVGLAYAACRSAADSVDQADETLSYLLNLFQAQQGDEEVAS